LLKRRINFAFGFKAATQVREPNLPTFAETIPFTHIEGTTVAGRGSHAPVSKEQGLDRAKQAKKTPHHI